MAENDEWGASGDWSCAFGLDEKGEGLLVGTLLGISVEREVAGVMVSGDRKKSPDERLAD